MATKTAKSNGQARSTRSGSRAPKNPKTKAQRLTRAKELTERMAARQAEVTALGAERDAILIALREEDEVTFREIASHVGTSEQAIHKAYHKATSA